MGNGLFFIVEFIMGLVMGYEAARGGKIVSIAKTGAFGRWRTREGKLWGGFELGGWWLVFG